MTQHKRRGFFFEGSWWTRGPHKESIDFQPPVLPHFLSSSSVTKVVIKQAFDSSNDWCPSRWHYLNMLHLQQQYNSISMYVWIPKWNLMLSRVFHDKLMRWHLQVTRSHRRLVSCPQTNTQQPLRLGALINSMIALVTCSVHMKMIVYVALSIHLSHPSVSQHCHFMPCFIIQKTFEENHQIWHFPDLDRKYEGVILLLRGSVSLQINGVEVDRIRFDWLWKVGCSVGRPESVCKIDTGRNALADVFQ